MANLRLLMQEVLANGRVSGDEMTKIREVLEADGKIDRQEADFLVELHKRTQRSTHGFEDFFYRLIKKHLLEDGKVDAEEVRWMRENLFDGGTVSDEAKKFLLQLRGEAQEHSPELDALCKELLGK